VLPSGKLDLQTACVNVWWMRGYEVPQKVCRLLDSMHELTPWTEAQLTIFAGSGTGALARIPLDFCTVMAASASKSDCRRGRT